MQTVSRKVGRHHLAFYRGWLQGLDIKSLSNHYLETGMDVRRAKSTLAWIQDTLRQAALRHGRRQEARLLRLRIRDGQPAEAVPLGEIPSLDEFRDDYDPEGVFSESELLQAYLEKYPTAIDRRARQRQRLVERQLEALRWIEPLLVTDPVAEDLVSAWFDTQIADRLVLAGVPTVGALMNRIGEKGYRWWITVPRLGEKGAARIVAWLKGYESSLGSVPEYAVMPIRRVPPAVLVSRRPGQTGIVPFESLAVPAHLDGSEGSNRHPGRPRIEASNDYQAIQSWLFTKAGSPHTSRAYRKEAERMLLWSVIEQGKALADLSIEDCTAYRNWLSMLGRTAHEQWPYRVPQTEWIGKRNVPRFSPGWRPFDGPLAESSVRQAVTIVSSLFEWLVRVQYCAFNPWDAVGTAMVRQDETPADVELTRVFSVGQWEYLMDYLQALPVEGSTQRLRFVLPFAYATGLRLAELVDAKTGRIYTRPLQDKIGVRWMLKVRGKGGKWRAVPLPTRIVALLSEYLAHRGLNPDPMENDPETPLIAKIVRNEPVSPSGLYKVITGLFEMAAAALRANGRNQEAKDFDRATVHWLRHTCGSHLGSGEVPVNLIQKLLGHASLATTSIYTESDEERLWKEIEQLEGRNAN